MGLLLFIAAMVFVISPYVGFWMVGLLAFWFLFVFIKDKVTYWRCWIR